MLRKFPRVSYERVLSGAGLFDHYEFLHRSEPSAMSVPAACYKSLVSTI
jgi:glucokinase